jgi:RNA polymerase sigma factor (sigma-70 family)
MDDWGLIQEFVHKQSGGAFEALVGRYLQMVHGVALRETGEHHRAEDVTQAVFALLAQKARTFREGTVVAAWLFRTAQFAGRNARKMERRRRFHEARAGRMRIGGTQASNLRDERMYRLDRSLDRLGQRDRGALLLRYYRRLEVADVGRALGISEKAAQKRVERAVAKLRGTVEAGGAAGMIGAMAGMGGSAATTPAAMATAALACAKGTAGHETITVMMKGATKMMFWAKMKVAAMVAAGVLVVGGAGTLTVSRLSAGTNEPPPAVAEAAPLKQQLAALDEAIGASRLKLANFGQANGIVRFQESIQQEYDLLARVENLKLDADLRAADLKYEVDGLKLKAANGAGGADLQARYADAEARHDAASNSAAFLLRKRDLVAAQLIELDHVHAYYDQVNGELQALQTARNDLYVRMVEQSAK